MEEGIKIGGKYKHFKTGNLYEVIAVGRHSETLEKLVVYKGLYDSEKFGNNPIWVRPFAEFVSMVNFNGKEVARFELVK